ncbi:MAG: glycoside hydrolase family 43 protein [Actinomycetota bacterium]|nr:glycoside hydrolase family 43 protein [Actinomycetota bacterium]
MTTAAVYAGDFPDPFALLVDGTYYAYATNAGTINVQLLSSRDLVSWTYLGDALPILPPWAEKGNTWAPAVLARPDGYVMYYTVREPRSGRQAISAATAAQPEGPFVDSSGGPLVFQQDLGGSIDPSPFVDSGDQPYLLWKADTNALGRRSSLWAQALAEDGLSLEGPPTMLLEHDCQWERPLIEAPSAVVSEGQYHLFYSANWWAGPDYAIGYAIADSLLGPYEKVTTRGPWMRSDGNVAGPGGQEFLLDANGDLQMVFHGWEPTAVGYPRGARSLRVARVVFDGSPRLDVAGGV